MITCYFKNLINNEIFSKEFSSPYEKNQFMIKCRYSKKIRYIGQGTQWA